MRSLSRVAACGALVATVASPAAPASASDREYRTTVGLTPLGTYAGQKSVRTADFHRFERAVPTGVRVFGPTVNEEFPVSANLEPATTSSASRPRRTRSSSTPTTRSRTSTAAATTRGPEPDNLALGEIDGRTTGPSPSRWRTAATSRTRATSAPRA